MFKPACAFHSHAILLFNGFRVCIRNARFDHRLQKAFSYGMVMLSPFSNSLVSNRFLHTFGHFPPFPIFSHNTTSSAFHFNQDVPIYECIDSINATDDGV